MTEIKQGDTVWVKMQVERVNDFGCTVQTMDSGKAVWTSEEYVQPLSGKHGYWMKKPGSSFMTCTCCMRTFADIGQNWDYCPKCGYPMDGKAVEE